MLTLFNEEFRLSDGALAYNRPLPDTLRFNDLHRRIYALSETIKLMVTATWSLIDAALMLYPTRTYWRNYR